MNTFEEIKELWLSEQEVIPHSDEIIQLVKKYQNRKKRMIYFMIFILILLVLILCYVFSFQNWKLWTTPLGEIIIVCAFLLTISIKMRLLKKEKLNYLKSNKEYLEEMKNIVSGRRKVGRTVFFTFILFGSGYGIFIFESVYPDIRMMLMTYLGILLYMLFMYFVFRLIINKYQNKQIEKLFKNIDYISKQLSD